MADPTGPALMRGTPASSVPSVPAADPSGPALMRGPAPTQSVGDLMFRTALEYQAGPGIGAMAHALYPLPDYGAPQTELTNKLFGGNENLGTHAFDVLAKTAPLAASFIPFGGPAARLIGRAGEVAGPIIAGAASGALFGSTNAAVKGEPVLPATVAGGVLGGATGGFFAGISPAGQKLARLYEARAALGDVPTLRELDAAVPHVGIDIVEQKARAGAAREAFEATVPRGSKKAEIDPVVWARAKADAREAAGTLGKGIKVNDELTLQGDLLERVLGRAGRVTSGDYMSKVMDDFRQLWGKYVTRLGTTLVRDVVAFGDEGAILGDKMMRATELSDRLEGELLAKFWHPIWRNVPKGEEVLIDSYLSGKGGQLSAEGVAAAARLRQMLDQGFDRMDAAGIQELARDTHPAASPAGLVDPYGAPVALPPQDIPGTGGGWKSIPIQKRTNYVPYYRDMVQMNRIAKAGTSERQAYLEKMVADGRADNIKHAGEVLDAMIDYEQRRVPLHIRSGPMQHQRELEMEFPRENDAKKWSRRWIHDYARRMGQAYVFDAKDEVYNKLVDQLAKKGGDVERFKRIYRLFVGRPQPEDVAYANVGRLARESVHLTMLGPRSGALQLTQLSNTAARLGWMRTLEGITAFWRHPELRAAAEEAGALLPSEHIATEQEAMEIATKWWVENITMLPRGDAMARRLSALSSGIATQKWARDYYAIYEAARGEAPRTGAAAALKYVGLRNKAEQAAILQNRLEKTAGIPVRLVIQHKGELPIDVLLSAMRNGSHNTQFASNLLDLPEMKSSPQGRIIFLLRTFAKQQSTFVKSMVADAARGDTGPITRYLLTYPALYAVAKPFLDLFSSRDLVDESDQAALDYAKEVLEASAITGMFGGMGDFINQMAQSDPGKLAMGVLGPVAGFAAGTIADTGAALHGDFSKLGWRALKMTPTSPLWYPTLKRWANQQ